MRRHAECVPVVGIWNVIFHELRLIIRGSLRQNLEIDPARRMARSNPRFNAKFMARLLHEREVHIVGDFSLNQRPPDSPPVGCSIYEDRSVTRPSLAEVHGCGAVASFEKPAIVRMKFQLVKSIKE